LSAALLAFEGAFVVDFLAVVGIEEGGAGEGS